MFTNWQMWKIKTAPSLTFCSVQSLFDEKKIISGEKP